ncbi:MAG TPA: family 1 glycosylhydrolase [Candidatus Ozemobacteraceae bacterium]|nr:family 1 glycosylhydrolase [Candidatus Ozemobacteraceae bacterium]
MRNQFLCFRRISVVLAVLMSLLGVAQGLEAREGKSRTRRVTQRSAVMSSSVLTPPTPVNQRYPFLWGVSTAGYQYEGGNDTSVWKRFEETGAVPMKCGRAANGFELFEADLDRARAMGLNAFRTSIEWGRIEPRQGEIDPAGVAFYHRLFQGMRKRGLTPVVTLVHFSWPQWLEDDLGGWQNPHSLRAFSRYVDFVSKEYGAEVDWWLTFNEPTVIILGGFATGQLAPGLKKPLLAAKVARHWVEAHKAAYDIIHCNDTQAMVGFNNYTGTYNVLGHDLIHFNIDSRRVSLSTSTLDKPWLELADPMRGKHLDYVGIDYYCRWRLPQAFTPAYTWEPAPEGFYQVIRNYHRVFRVPVLIAENGMATRNLQPRTDGWTREAFLVQHVRQMQRAMREGVPVLGYIHWSITDNYEWGSYEPRFGLYSVECAAEDFRRLPTSAVAVYREIATSGGVSDALAARFPAPVGRSKTGD